MVAAIVPAAGQSRRMGDGGNKVLRSLAGQPVLVRSIRALAAGVKIDSIVVAAAPQEVAAVTAVLERWVPDLPWLVVAGGTERQDSIANALQKVPDSAEIILVHDGARPLVDAKIVQAVLAAARAGGAAVAAVRVKDTIKIADPEGYIKTTPDRSTLWAVQTPQAFEAGLLRRAYAAAGASGYYGTDDAALVERLGVPVKLIAGDYRNIKITTPEDFVVAEALLSERENMVWPLVRVGIGYDVHRLVPGRRLVLGGVVIPFDLGLEGHSDADVLLHALKDALLGASGLGDIGQHFPDSDPQYRGISSLTLLEKVKLLLESAKLRAANVDVTVVAQKPRLAPFIPQMKENIARVLNLPPGRVNVKATTTEGLGFAGRQEGIAAYAVVSVTETNASNA